jgi:hypothetical protein
MTGMAGPFGMMSRKDSKSTLAERREAIARLKRSEVDTPTRVFGEAAKAVLPDVGVLNRAVRDPIGTAKGVAEVASLASPAANAYRAYKLATGDGFSVTGADMEDVEQAVETAGIIPTSKVVAAPFKIGMRGAETLATNPRVVGSLMDATNVASSGARPAEVIATGLAGLMRGNLPTAPVAEPLKFSGSKVGELLAGNQVRQAVNILRGSRRNRIKGDNERNVGSRTIFPEQRIRLGRTTDRPTTARNPETLAEKQATWDRQPDLLDNYNKFITDNPNWAEHGDQIVEGHLIARSKGGEEIAYLTKKTNDAMGSKNIDEFVNEEISKGLTLEEVKNKWHLNHISDDVLLGASV